MIKSQSWSQSPRMLYWGTAATASIATLLVLLQIGGIGISALNAVSAYLLLTLLASAAFGMRVGFVVAAASALLINFFFVEPIFGFAMSDRQHVLSLPVFFIVAAIGALLSAQSVQASVEANRETHVSDVLVFDALRVYKTDHRVLLDDSEIHLTPTEFRLLAFLTSNAGRVLSPQLILENVWGVEYAKDVRILRTYINQLRVKLNDKLVRPRFIRTEPGYGYRFLTPEVLAEESSPTPAEA